MCGIAGIIAPHQALVQAHTLQHMLQPLLHRGPDHSDTWIADNGLVALGHNRLSIVDLRASAHQPMHYLHYTISFNGEIYNYLELKTILQQKGYQFNTQSDTEVVMAAFDCWGIQCLNFFDGMFAFALYSHKDQEVWIARDRFGEKPLFYHTTYAQRGRFERVIFASEMKALWQAGAPKNLNGTMVYNYLTLGYVANPIKKTQTFYNDILKLPAASYLHIQPALGKIHLKKWYQPASFSIENNTPEAWQTKFDALLKQSVERRLRCDVACGFSLSGGIDSSAIAALARQINNNAELHAFTAIFPGFHNDESANSKLMAKHLGLHHHLVEVTAGDWLNRWEHIAQHQEEPMQSASVVTQFMVYETAHQHGIKVLLDGQGADELLGGYKKYTAWYLQDLLQKRKFRQFLAEKQLFQQHQLLNPSNILHWLSALLSPHTKANLLQSKAYLQQQRNKLIHPNFSVQYQNRDTLTKPLVQSVKDLLAHQALHFGLEELLRYADRNSMAHSCEVRLPFLSHKLAECIFALPVDLLFKNGYTKWILRNTHQNLLPQTIAWQKGKIGFEPPQKKWMEDADIKNMMLDSVQTLINRQILHPKAAQQPYQPADAHAENNLYWRSLNIAALFK